MCAPMTTRARTRTGTASGVAIRVDPRPGVTMVRAFDVVVVIMIFWAVLGSRRNQIQLLCC